MVSDRLQSVFYQLVQQENGYISILNFAIAAQIMPAEAKRCRRDFETAAKYQNVLCDRICSNEVSCCTSLLVSSRCFPLADYSPATARFKPCFFLRQDIVEFPQLLLLRELKPLFTGILSFSQHNA